MLLTTLKLKGFRNFKDATVNFRKKTLIIGANDVGKTNMVWAIRLLLDRSLNDYELEPQDSDFYAFAPTNTFIITLKFTEITEDCVMSRMKGKISDDGKMILQYEAYRDPQSKAKSYRLLAGPSKDKLEEIEDRFYRKVLNVKVINSRRDLHNYIGREKHHLFQLAKDNRSPEEQTADEKLYSDIEKDLASVDGKIPKLNYIASATNTINEELDKLSLHHNKQKVYFDVSSSNIDNFINNVSISSKSNNQNVLIGGDGRLNQIYLALWASRNELTEESLKEVTIFCIEEPEAHLHPHQQRKLADYLNDSIKGQVFLTSHSPQIASEFSPNSIVRLLSNKGETHAASNGCSDIIDASFKDFGYRMSIIPAEAFFADAVLLIEGPSEEMFYKTLAKQINIDLDRLNISVLMVDGIGFKPFINILNSLEINWALRTDNDIMKIPKQEAYRYAGVQRCVSYYKEFFVKDDNTEQILEEHQANLSGFPTEEPDQDNINAAKAITEDLEAYNIFLSHKDLEHDLMNSDLLIDLEFFFEFADGASIIADMQKRKASFMFDFLKDDSGVLSKLENDPLSKPLKACVKLVNDIQNEAY